MATPPDNSSPIGSASAMPVLCQANRFIYDNLSYQVESCHIWGALGGHTKNYVGSLEGLTDAESVERFTGNIAVPARDTSSVALDKKDSTWTVVTGSVKCVRHPTTSLASAIAATNTQSV